jgi:hypothetical protein
MRREMPWQSFLPLFMIDPRKAHVEVELAGGAHDQGAAGRNGDRLALRADCRPRNYAGFTRRWPLDLLGSNPAVILPHCCKSTH